MQGLEELGHHVQVLADVRFGGGVTQVEVQPDEVGCGLGRAVLQPCGGFCERDGHTGLAIFKAIAVQHAGLVRSVGDLHVRGGVGWGVSDQGGSFWHWGDKAVTRRVVMCTGWRRLQ